jgi:hypothetical protein
VRVERQDVSVRRSRNLDRSVAFPFHDHLWLGPERYPCQPLMESPKRVISSGRARPAVSSLANTFGRCCDKSQYVQMRSAGLNAPTGATPTRPQVEDAGPGERPGTGFLRMTIRDGVPTLWA